MWFIDAILAIDRMQFWSVWQNGSKGCGKMVVSNMIDDVIAAWDEYRKSAGPHLEDDMRSFMAGYVRAAKSCDRRIAALELELAIRLSSRGML